MVQVRLRSADSRLFRLRVALLAAGLGLMGLPLALRFWSWPPDPVRFVAQFLAAFLLYLFACALVLKGADHLGKGALALILAFAVAFRLAMLLTAPGLSDDVYRYVWDGKVASNGFNPYRYAPDSPALASLRDDLWVGINHKHMATPYPPLAQVVFTLGYLAQPGSFKPMQVAAATVDLLVIATLLALLHIRGQPGARVLIYAWNPLPLVQFAHSAHNDALMIWLLLAALWLATIRRPALGAAALAGAALAKLVPLLAVPVLARRWRWHSAVAFAAVLLAGYAPFLSDAPSLLQGIVYEAGDARFNESIYYVVSRALSLVLPSPDAAARLLTLGVLGLWIAVLTLTPTLSQGEREKPSPLSCPAGEGPGVRETRSTYLVLGAFLLLSPSVEPWYLTWILPFLSLYLERGAGRLPFALTPALGWLLLSGLVELTEVTYGGANPRLWIAIRAVEYLPLYSLLALDVARRMLPLAAVRALSGQRGFGDRGS